VSCVSLATRGQTDMRGLITAGRAVRLERFRLSRIERRPPGSVLLIAARPNRRCGRHPRAGIHAPAGGAQARTNSCRRNQAGCGGIDSAVVHRQRRLPSRERRVPGSLVEHQGPRQRGALSADPALLKLSPFLAIDALTAQRARWPDRRGHERPRSATRWRAPPSTTVRTGASPYRGFGRPLTWPASKTSWSQASSQPWKVRTSRAWPSDLPLPPRSWRQLRR
jgi:hypothetical protein